MSHKSWVSLGVGAAVALTVGGLWWALRGGPPAALATSSAPAPGPAASSGPSPVEEDPSRGRAQSSPDSGSKASEFFSSGLALLDGALPGLFGR